GGGGGGGDEDGGADAGTISADGAEAEARDESSRDGADSERGSSSTAPKADAAVVSGTAAGVAKAGLSGKEDATATEEKTLSASRPNSPAPSQDSSETETTGSSTAAAGPAGPDGRGKGPPSPQKHPGGEGGCEPKVLAAMLTEMGVVDDAVVGDEGLPVLRALLREAGGEADLAVDLFFENGKEIDGEADPMRETSADREKPQENTNRKSTLRPRAGPASCFFCGSAMPAKWTRMRKGQGKGWNKKKNASAGGFAGTAAGSSKSADGAVSPDLIWVCGQDYCLGTAEGIGYEAQEVLLSDRAVRTDDTESGPDEPATTYGGGGGGTGEGSKSGCSSDGEAGGDGGVEAGEDGDSQSAVTSIATTVLEEEALGPTQSRQQGDTAAEGGECRDDGGGDAVGKQPAETGTTRELDVLTSQGAGGVVGADGEPEPEPQSPECEVAAVDAPKGTAAAVAVEVVDDGEEAAAEAEAEAAGVSAAKKTSGSLADREEEAREACAVVLGKVSVEGAPALTGSGEVSKQGDRGGDRQRRRRRRPFESFGEVSDDDEDDATNDGGGSPDRGKRSDGAAGGAPPPSSVVDLTLSDDEDGDNGIGGGSSSQKDQGGSEDTEKSPTVQRPPSSPREGGGKGKGRKEPDEIEPPSKPSARKLSLASTSSPPSPSSSRKRGGAGKAPSLEDFWGNATGGSGGVLSAN
ncbi:unnamed protein product, partial [Scytosiphon promiscuus]